MTELINSSILIGLGTILGLVLGLILGSWLDARDILYSCPRCRKNNILSNLEKE